MHCGQLFRKAWERGIHDGTGTCSEGTHDFVNQLIVMQLAWDPSRPEDEILDELCQYYFGEKAAPLAKESLLLMENQRNRRITDPLADQDEQIQVLVSKAEEVMPPWARSSRQWALIVGRAGIDRTMSRQAELMKEFDKHWELYQSLLGGSPSSSRPIWFEETRAYFQAVLDNAHEIIRVYKKMNRQGYGVLGGSQFCWWPDPRTGQAAEALTALENWTGDARLQTPARAAIALLDQDGRVVVTDGWSNYVQLKAAGAADGRLVIADVRGAGSKQVIFLSEDGKLHSWSLIEKTSAVFAKGEFLTGPLASGYLNSSQREEVLVLEGRSTKDAHLAVVNGEGNVRSLKVCPAGAAPTEATGGVVLGAILFT